MNKNMGRSAEKRDRERERERRIEEMCREKRKSVEGGSNDNIRSNTQPREDRWVLNRSPADHDPAHSQITELSDLIL